MQGTQQKIVEAAILVLNDDLPASIDKIASWCDAPHAAPLFPRPARPVRLVPAQYAAQLPAGYRRRLRQLAPPPRQQLERLLYASIDSGTKYAFLYMLNLQQPPQLAEGEAITFQPLQQVVHQQGARSPAPTVPWIPLFFAGVGQITVRAEVVGAVARQTSKELVRCSSSQGIGLGPLVPASWA